MVVEERAQRLEAVRAERDAMPEFSDEEVVLDAAVDVRKATQGEDILTEPIRQNEDIVGQGDGLFFLGPGVGEFGRPARVGVSMALSMGGGLAFELIADSDGFVGSLFQGGNDGQNFLQPMENVAPARCIRKGQGAARTQSGAEVRDEPLGVQTMVLKFE